MIKNVIRGVAIATFAFAVVAAPFVRPQKASATTFISSCSESKPVYQRGDTGFCVKIIQEMLNRTRVKYGQTNNPYWPIMSVPFDGIYGPKTEQAVVAFQFVHKVKNSAVVVDGKVGQQTWFLFYVDCLSFDPDPQPCRVI